MVGQFKPAGLVISLQHTCIHNITLCICKQKGIPIDMFQTKSMLVQWQVNSCGWSTAHSARTHRLLYLPKSLNPLPKSPNPAPKPPPKPPPNPSPNPPMSKNPPPPPLSLLCLWSVSCLLCCCPARGTRNTKLMEAKRCKAGCTRKPCY